MVAAESSQTAKEEVSQQLVGEDMMEAELVLSVTQIATLVIEEEQFLNETSEALASLLLDAQITATADEELNSYIYSVQVANAIEEKLDEIADEIIET